MIRRLSVARIRWRSNQAPQRAQQTPTVLLLPLLPLQPLRPLRPSRLRSSHRHAPAQQAAPNARTSARRRWVQHRRPPARAIELRLLLLLHQVWPLRRPLQASCIRRRSLRSRLSKPLEWRMSLRPCFRSLRRSRTHSRRMASRHLTRNNNSSNNQNQEKKNSNKEKKTTLLHRRSRAPNPIRSLLLVAFDVVRVALL